MVSIQYVLVKWMNRQTDEQSDLMVCFEPIQINQAIQINLGKLDN